VTKECAFALLAPGHDRVCTLAHAYRHPRQVNTVHNKMTFVTRWLNWLTGRGIVSLAAVTDAQCLAFVADQQVARDEEGRIVGPTPGMAEAGAQEVIGLGLYRELFTHDRFDPTLRPFAGRSAHCPPNQLTTTVDHARGRRLGIHLDNFDQQPTDQREHSRRRLALNLGPGPRYLILTLATIQDIAGQTTDFPRYPHTDDVHRYLREGRELPCLRVRLDPGDGYIAPTELIPHDGSTHGVDQPSRIAFWLGHWPGGAPHRLPSGG
jgi:hypothetical protein